MATVLFLNNYQTTLGAALSSTATTMTVSSTTGLPSSLASGQFIPMTLTPASSPGSDYEIVYVTGISGSTLTVERGQEGTSALNWNTGDILYSTNTAQTTGASMGSPSTDFQTNTLTASGLITANDGIDVAGGTLTIPNATASNNPVALGQFVQSLSSNGYQMLPSGLIIQWGSLNVGPNSSATFTFPIAFPHAMLQLVLTQNETVPTTGAWGWGNNTSTQVGIYNGNSGSASVSIICIGY